MDSNGRLEKVRWSDVKENGKGRMINTTDHNPTNPSNMKAKAL